MCSHPSNNSRQMALCLQLSLVPEIGSANAKGSDETAQMHSLAWALAVRLCNKYFLACLNNVQEELLYYRWIYVSWPCWQPMFIYIYIDIPVLNSACCLQIKQMSILPRYLNLLIPPASALALTFANVKVLRQSLAWIDIRFLNASERKSMISCELSCPLTGLITWLGPYMAPRWFFLSGLIL